MTDLIILFSFVSVGWFTVSVNMNRQSCTNHPHSFGYICGKYTPPSHCKIIAKRVKTAYKCYFKGQVKNQDNRWVPHICYISYSSVLTVWMNRKIKQMPFWVPIVWRKQVDHHSGCCFFCMTKLSRFSRKNKSKIMCLDCQSALKPVSHDLGYLCHSSCKKWHRKWRNLQK